MRVVQDRGFNVENNYFNYMYRGGKWAGYDTARSLFKNFLSQGTRRYSYQNADTLHILQMAMSSSLLPNSNFDGPDHMNEYLDVFLLSEDESSHLDRTRLLSTTTGRRFGWIPEQARVNDYVCLLESFPAPFIVRKRDDGYCAIVGDAYINGVMHGEAWSAAACKIIEFK